MSGILTFTVETRTDKKQTKHKMNTIEMKVLGAIKRRNTGGKTNKQ